MGKTTKEATAVEQTAEAVVSEATVEVVEEVTETAVEVVEEALNAEVIASDVFIAEDGTECEFAVAHFIHGRKRYYVADAVLNDSDVLQKLYEMNSTIFKKNN